MEKSEGNRPQEQVDEIRDPEIYQEVESDNLQPNRQLQKNKAQNVMEQCVLETKEKNEESRTEEGEKQEETDVKQKVKRSAENVFVQTHESIPTVHQERVEFAEDEIFELEKEIAVQTRTENLEKITLDPAKDSIKYEHDSNDSTQGKWDRIAKNEHMEINSALQQRTGLQRTISISSEKGLQQPCEVSKENAQITEEQDIVTQQETETKDRVLGTPKDREDQNNAQDQESIQREKNLTNMLADFFNKQNQVTMQHKTDSQEDNLIAPLQNSIPTAGHESSNETRQELDKTDQKERLETNATLQQSDQSRKLSILNTEKEGPQKPGEVSEETVKEEQDIVMKQKSAVQDKDLNAPAETDTQKQKLRQQEQLRNMCAEFFNKQNKDSVHQRAEIQNQITIPPAVDSQMAQESDSKTLARADTQKQKLMQREKLKNMFAEFFNKQNQDSVIQRAKIQKQIIAPAVDSEITQENDSKTLAVADTQNQQGKGIHHQKDAHNNAEDIESQKTKQTITYRDQEIRKALKKEHGDASFEEVLTRSRESKQNVNTNLSETKESKKLERGSQPSKDYFTRNILESDDTTARPENMNGCLSSFARRSDGTSECSRKTEDIYSFLARISMQDYVTSRPPRSDNETGSTCPKPFKTAHSSRKKDYVTFKPRRSDNETVSNCRERFETARSSRKKDYVTSLPRRSDDETANTNISRGFSSTSKDYVTINIIEQKTTPRDPQPPTPIFRSVQEDESAQGWSTQSHTLPRSLQEPVSIPKSKKPLQVSWGTQQLEGGKKVLLPPLQDRTLQTQIKSQVPEDYDFPLLPLEEEYPESTMGTNESRFLKNWRILQTGIQDFLQWFNNNFNSAASHIPSNRFSIKCISLFSLLAIVIILALVFAILLAINVSDTSVSNVTSSPPDSHLNMKSTVIDAIRYRQSESLDGKVSIPLTRLDITDFDSNDIFTSPWAGIDVNITNSLADMGGEVIPVMNGLNDNLNTNEINSVSNVKLINFDFGVTTPVNDFDVNFITHVTDWKINAINTVAYVDSNIINPITCLSNNETNPVTDVINVINHDTDLDMNVH